MRTFAVRLLALLTTALAWTGCAAEPGGQPELLRDDIPAPPEGGVQIVSQIFEVPANSEIFMCMKVPFEVAERMLVSESAVYQAQNGHHTLVFYADGSTAGVDPNPHECDGFEMTNVRIVTVGTTNGTGISMPEGVVLDVPQGAEVWIQSHYINTTSEPALAQDVINLALVEEASVEHIASTFAHVDLTFTVPAGEEFTRTMECTIPRDMNVPWFLPHMHDWGKNFKIDITRDGEELWSYNGDWFASFREDFPIQDLQQTLELKAGDTITTTCTWQNTEQRSLLWPEEMCVTFFPFYPGDGGLLACDETGDVFEP